MPHAVLYIYTVCSTWLVVAIPGEETASVLRVYKVEPEVE